MAKYGVEIVDITNQPVVGDHPPVTKEALIASGQTVNINAVLGLSRATSKHSQLTLEQAVADEVVGAGTGSLKLFEGWLANGGVVPGSVAIAATIGAGASALADDGLGRLSGDDGDGFIDYASGYFRLSFDTAPDNSTNVTASYSHDNGGLAVADCVLLETVDATEGDEPGLALEHGVALAWAMVWPDSISADQKTRALAQLTAKGLFVEEE